MSTASPPSLQRRTEMRAQPDWLEAARADSGTRFLICRDTTHLVRNDPQASIAFLRAGDLELDAIDASRLVLLGWFHGERCVMVDLPPGLALSPPGTTYEELRPLLPRQTADEAQLLTYARA